MYVTVVPDQVLSKILDLEDSDYPSLSEAAFQMVLSQKSSSKFIEDTDVGELFSINHPMFGIYPPHFFMLRSMISSH